MLSYDKALKYRKLQADVANTYKAMQAAKKGTPEAFRAVQAWQAAIDRADAFLARWEI